MKNIIKLKEQGFCFGVKRSIEIVEDILKNESTKKPIYLLGSLVHNKHVNDYFKRKGIIVLENSSRQKMLDEIKEGTVIITAHGVSDKVLNKAKEKKLDIVNATCPYVTKTVDVIKEKVKEGYKLLYIGKLNHPEVETILDEVSDAIIIDNNTLPVLDKNNKYIIAHQTTLSDYDVETVTKEIIKKYPFVKLLKQICMFPEKRQQEINNYIFPKGRNLSIVVGDTKSNNSTKLKELFLRKKQSDVIMINDVEEIDESNIIDYDNIIIASGTSTPIKIVDEIYKKIGGK